MNYKLLLLTLFSVIIMPCVAIGAEPIPQGNSTINIIPYNVSFNYTLNEDKNLTVLELNTSKEYDIVAYFDNSVPEFYNPNMTNDSTIKTFDFEIINGTLAVFGVNASGYNMVNETINCTFVGWNKTLGYAFFMMDDIGAGKRGVVKLQNYIESTTNIIDNTSSPPSGISGGGGSSPNVATYSDVAKDIKSSKIKEIVHNAKLIIGSEIDGDLSAKNLKNNPLLTDKELEIKEDTILVGGPVANPLTNKYTWTFKVKITNDNPGTNKGVIQKQLINGHTVILLAGSDRYGTKAAVEYFKTLDDIPNEPIFVQWKDGKAVKIE